MGNVMNVGSPLSGKRVALSEVKDDLFKSSAMGPTIAIDADTCELYAPEDAEMTVVFPTSHAYGMKLKSGVELFIHIGINTVELNGNGFETFVKQGDVVKANTLLAKFDKEFIESKGIDSTVMVIVSNASEFEDVKVNENLDVVGLNSKVFEVTKMAKSVEREDKKMTKNEQLAHDILECVGGMENVNKVTHCATRLRFNLKDESIVKEDELKQLNILKVMKAGGQFQVVVGPEVPDVFKYIGFTGDEDSSNETTEKVSVLNRVFDTISGSFSPLIPVFCGAGLVKAVCAVLTMLNILQATDSTYLILSAAGNSVFYFLPVILGFSIAKKLNVSPYVAAAIGAALLEPNFTGLAAAKGAVTFAGIPVFVSDYSSSVLPIFGAVLLQYVVEKFLKKILPNQVHLIFVPFLTLLVVLPLTVLTFGPFGIYVGNALADFINIMMANSAILAGAILSAIWIFVVVLGLHWAIIPILINNIAINGSDPLMGVLQGASWVAVGIAVVSMGICGALGGLIGVAATQLAGGIFTILTYLPFVNYLIVMAVAILLPVVLIMIFGLGEESK